jgi:hypothetical protein
VLELHLHFVMLSEALGDQVFGGHGTHSKSSAQAGNVACVFFLLQVFVGQLLIVCGL